MKASEAREITNSSMRDIDYIYRLIEANAPTGVDSIIIDKKMYPNLQKNIIELELNGYVVETTETSNYLTIKW